MKKLYVFFKDFGRMGEIEGLFIADDSQIDRIMGEEIYFGEALGKHSEVVVTMTEETLTVKTDDQEFIEKLEELMGTDISGYNPFNFFHPDE